mmetsp:Transcript_8543/g.31985  ORF Transcript_8543/g.31985 Transcript_8543/m.31985 type:complete len:205 (+) Transcript_8543:1824-2438(+)
MIVEKRTLACFSHRWPAFSLRRHSCAGYAGELRPYRIRATARADIHPAPPALPPDLCVNNSRTSCTKPRGGSFAMTAETRETVSDEVPPVPVVSTGPSPRVSSAVPYPIPSSIPPPGGAPKYACNVTLKLALCVSSVSQFAASSSAAYTVSSFDTAHCSTFVRCAASTLASGRTSRGGVFRISYPTARSVKRYAPSPFALSACS